MSATILITALSIHIDSVRDAVRNELLYIEKEEQNGDKTLLTVHGEEPDEMDWENDLIEKKIPYDKYWADKEANDFGNDYVRFDDAGNCVCRRIFPREQPSILLSDVEDAVANGTIEALIAERKHLNDPTTVLSWESQIDNPHVPK